MIIVKLCFLLSPPFGVISFRISILKEEIYWRPSLKKQTAIDV